MKYFLQSKIFWTNVVIIVGSVGTIFTGEMTIDQILPKIIVAVLAILSIFFRWNTTAPLTGSK